MVILDDDEEASMGEFVLGFLERERERERDGGGESEWDEIMRVKEENPFYDLVCFAVRRNFCGNIVGNLFKIRIVSKNSIATEAFYWINIKRFLFPHKITLQNMER